MRLGPDLSPYGDELPELGDLLPEEIRYLCDVCHLLDKLGVCKLGRLSQAQLEAIDDARFDRDELGIDPEEDIDA